MAIFTSFVNKLSRFLDKLAGLFLSAMVLLMVANIVLRELFHKPFLGTYELVSLFSAALIGLALAYCAVQNGHIAVTIVTDRLPRIPKALVESAVNIIGFCFWGVTSWQVIEYGRSLMESGVVSPTTQIPFYPFVFLVAFGIFNLCLVLLIHSAQSLKKVVMEVECRNRRADRSIDIFNIDNA
jgi:TRAP-type C4-dicarboxylate transport system permease small subunit